TATNGNTIYFYDPIASNPATVNRRLKIEINDDPSQTGVILFDTYQSNVYFESPGIGAKISYGTILLQNGAIFGANDNIGDFTVGENATLAIAGDGEIKGGSAIFSDGATIGTIAASPNNNNVILPNAKLSGVLNVDIKNDNQNFTLNADLEDENASINASLVKEGSGTLILTGTNNTYSGDTIINNGTLKGNIAVDTDLSIASGASYDGDGQLRAINELSGAGNVQNTTGITAKSGTFDGNIDSTNTGDLTKDSTGTLTLTGNNTYTGNTVINNGTLKGNIAVDTDLSIASGAIYDGNGSERKINGLSGAGDVQNTDGFIVESGTFTGNMDNSNTGGLTKVSSGTLTFAGNNTYTGTTSIENGTFVLAGSLASTEFFLHDGTTFDAASGTPPTVNKLTVSGNATYNGNLNAVNSTLIFSDIKPSAVNAANPLLSVNGNADITNSDVLLQFTTNTLFNDKDEVLLLNATSGLDSIGVKALPPVGVGLGLYSFELFTDANNLIAQVSRQVNPATKALSEARLGNIAFLTQGQDLLTSEGLDSLLQENKLENNTFGAMGGSSLRYNTGSHIDVKGFHFLGGISKNKNIGNSTLKAGVFFEGGNGSYKTYNDFVGYSSVHGKGENKYFGVGLILRTDYESGLYWDASVRLGRTDYEFKTSNLGGQHADYKSSNVYYGAHFGLGYQYKTEANVIDWYGKVFYNRQQKDSVHVLNQKVEFGAMSSLRTKVGVRFTHKIENSFGLYSGIAYQNEFRGTTNGSVVGFGDIDAPSMRGSVGIGEIGFRYEGVRFDTKIGIQGYIGKIEGISGSLKLGYKF
ncbi:MAG: autotransporter-associated beta strand repeat-containing protein, partial [Fusobacteriaceae bacterium]|nr:autotransporter-associated beta strand repeat-containing protein [Fusobacteriaceae bacterium]